MRRFLLGYALLQTCIAFSQSPPVEAPFGLRADILGETLAEFRTNNAQVIKYSSLGNPDSLKTVHFPICTNDDVAPGDEPQKGDGANNIDLVVDAAEAKQGVTYCVAGSWILNADRAGNISYVNIPTIAKVGTKSIRYHFLKGRLFRIEVVFNKTGYEDILEAMKNKYGQPSSSANLTYQNGFGAQIQTRHLAWKNALSKIELSESPTGYLDNLDITLDSAEKELKQLLAVKDREKDL